MASQFPLAPATPHPQKKKILGELWITNILTLFLLLTSPFKILVPSVFELLCYRILVFINETVVHSQGVRRKVCNSKNALLY